MTSWLYFIDRAVRVNSTNNQRCLLWSARPHTEREPPNEPSIDLTLPSWIHPACVLLALSLCFTGCDGDESASCDYTQTYSEGESFIYGRMQHLRVNPVAKSPAR